MHREATTLLERVEAFLQNQDCFRAKRWVVALSGGRDSTVLLHSLNVLAKKHSKTLVAWHVNHQLQAHSDGWAQHALDFAASLGLPCQVFKVSVDQNNGLGLEANAREARYQVFSQQALTGDILFLAHHQGDNAETFLHHACRGSGPKGLAGMAPVQWLNHHSYALMRPLLEVSPHFIQEYASSLSLTWVEDPSNQDIQFRRNYLRHQVMPQLEAAYPAAMDCLARSARLCAEAAQLIEEVAREDIQRCQLGFSSEGWLNKEAFLSLSMARQKQVIRCLIADLGGLMPRQDHLETWIQAIQTAALQERHFLEGQNWEVVAYPNRICIRSKNL